MRVFATLLLIALVGCAAPKRGDLIGEPFTFIGIPRGLSQKTFQDIDGLERGLLVDVVRVTAGTFDEKQIEFPIPASQLSPLKAGVKYSITAGYNPHGRVILDYHEVK
jgi:hypothetical protein